MQMQLLMAPNLEMRSDLDDILTYLICLCREYFPIIAVYTRDLHAVVFSSVSCHSQKLIIQCDHWLITLKHIRVSNEPIPKIVTTANEQVRVSEWLKHRKYSLWIDVFSSDSSGLFGNWPAFWNIIKQSYDHETFFRFRMRWLDRNVVLQYFATVLIALFWIYHIVLVCCNSLIQTTTYV